MKIIEIELNNIKYSINPMNAHDATYWTMQLLPIAVPLKSILTKDDSGEAIGTALAGLSKQRYTDIVHAMFDGVKKHDHGTITSIVKDGIFLYDDVKNDPYIYLSLLKESFKLNFKDFFVSAARVFPAVAAILDILSSTQPSANT